MALIPNIEDIQKDTQNIEVDTKIQRGVRRGLI